VGHWRKSWIHHRHRRGLNWRSRDGRGARCRWLRHWQRCRRWRRWCSACSQHE
jgi:hypothetical protein